MSQSAKVVRDSVSEEKVRLPTFECEYPRFVHSELLTHRVFSRNAASSRAIPVKRSIKNVLENPAMPMHYGKNQKGMQAYEENRNLVMLQSYQRSLRDVAKVTGQESEATHLYAKTEQAVTNEEAWLRARDFAVEIARGYDEAGYHKQIVNRILEPFNHITTIISSTALKNFFSLRVAPDVQYEMRDLAEKMLNALEDSKPRLVPFGQWHLPYVKCNEHYHSIETLRKYSAARIARVSYANHDGTAPNHATDMNTFKQLVESTSIHGSPLEHPATPVPRHKGSNFYGWLQYRELIDVGQPYNEFYTGEIIDWRD